MVQAALTREQVRSCFPVMKELRPHLSLDEFEIRIRRQQWEGYQLVYLEQASVVVSVAGYRILSSLSRGTFCYLDDLVTAERWKRQGYGGALFDWLRETARDAECEELHLDSGLQRTEAHQFYEKRFMHFSGRHYVLKI